MIVFKLERERPAFATHATTLYSIKERHLRSYDFQTQRETTLFSLRRPSTSGDIHSLLAVLLIMSQAEQDLLKCHMPICEICLSCIDL